MNLEQLVGRYFRLNQELLEAGNTRPSQARLVGRLAADIEVTKREIESFRAMGHGVPAEFRQAA